MIIWLDAQLSPLLAEWIGAHFPVTATPVRELGLRDAEDREIFDAARSKNAIVMTKDRDFVMLLERLGPPPKVLWIRFGNTSNQRMQEILTSQLSTALRLLEAGDDLVEIRG